MTMMILAVQTGVNAKLINLKSKQIVLKTGSSKMMPRSAQMAKSLKVI
jgi:hypothetical protein